MPGLHAEGGGVLARKRRSAWQQLPAPVDSKPKLLKEVRRLAHFVDAFPCFRSRVGVVAKSPAMLFAVIGSSLWKAASLLTAACEAPRRMV